MWWMDIDVNVVEGVNQHRIPGVKQPSEKRSVGSATSLIILYKWVVKSLIFQKR
jgi:hypothetical protein